MVNVLFSSDKFAGTMAADEACAAMAIGWQRTRPHDQIRCVPMADGGPGTVDVVARACRATLHSGRTVNQANEPIEATWLELSHGRALLESATVCGLDLVERTRRNPLTDTTRGLGVLLAQVLQRDFERILIGVGGTGTIDGGLNAVVELGLEVRDRSRNAMDTPIHPASYFEIADIGDPLELPCELLVLADVSNSLLGAMGAARTFGPQKGASHDQIDLLEQAMQHLADQAGKRRTLGGREPWAWPGSGAGGGLGFGLAAWTSAELGGGASTVAELIGLDEHIEWADIVVTGEGRIDGQTSAGKVPSFVAGLAREAEKAVYAVAGSAELDALGVFDDWALLGPMGLARPVEETVRASSDLAERIP